MKKEYGIIVEVFLILAGCTLYYFSHTVDLFEFVGSLTGIAIATLFIGYIPYSFFKEKIGNPKLKVFAVTFLLLNLLLFVSAQPL